MFGRALNGEKMKLVTIALALLMLATAAHADGKPVSKKPYSDWVWEDIGCGRKCPEQEGIERAHREFDKADAIRRRDQAYANFRRRLLAGAKESGSGSAASLSKLSR
jgi:hypothetical protein